MFHYYPYLYRIPGFKGRRKNKPRAKTQRREVKSADDADFTDKLNIFTLELSKLDNPITINLYSSKAA